MCLWNSRSLVNKLGLFQSFVTVSSYKIYAIVETWCNNFIFDNEITVPHFQIIRKDRDSRGGGVLLLIHDSIPFRELAQSAPNSSETVAVEIFVPQSIIICLTYFPPDVNPLFVNATLAYFSSITMTGDQNCILMGDFNMPHIGWHSLSSKNSISKVFCDFVFDNNLIQLVESPTHSKGNILDLVLTNSVNQVVDLSVLSLDPFPRLRSDHKLVCFKIPTKRPKPKSSTILPRFNFAKGNYSSMNDYINSLDFSCYFNSSDIEFQWSFLKSVIYNCYDLFIPKVKCRTTRYPKWFNSDLVHDSHHVKYLRKKVIASPSVHNTLTLRDAEFKLSEDVSSAKALFEEDLVKSHAFSNPSPIFKYIRSFKSNHANIPSTMFMDSETSSSETGILNLFNKFFNSVFTPCSSPVTSAPPKSSSCSDEITIEEEDIFNRLCRLDPAKAMGIDNIPNTVLKLCAQSLCRPIHQLFIQCGLIKLFPSTNRLANPQ